MPERPGLVFNPIPCGAVAEWAEWAVGGQNLGSGPAASAGFVRPQE